MQRTDTDLWTWLGDHLAVDFANTVRVLDGRRQELVATPAELATWLYLERDALPDPGPVDESLRRAFVSLRDAALEVLHAACVEAPLPQAAISRLNAAVTDAGTCRLLTGRTHASSYTARATASAKTALLGRLAAAVVELVAMEDLANLALCPAPRCGQFFHRARPNQRWCSAGCGNRARVDRHRHRRTST